MSKARYVVAVDIEPGIQRPFIAMTGDAWDELVKEDAYHAIAAKADDDGYTLFWSSSNAAVNEACEKHGLTIQMLINEWNRYQNAKEGH